MAEPLSFGKDLDEEQRGVAAKIIERASAMGVDPRLAVAVAYQESRLRPNVGRSPKGAVGIMQVMPATGKDFGFSMEDLKDTDRNIDAGLTVLKSYLAQFPEDPRLGVVAYNAGPNHSFFKGGDLPAETQEYLTNLKSYGAFTPGGEPTMTEEDIEEDEGYSLEAEQAEKDAQEVRQAQLYGGGAGAALGAARGVGDVAGSAIQGLAQRAVEGAQRATQAPTIPGVSQPPAAAQQSGFERAIQGAEDEQGRTGRQRQNIYNTETGRQAAQRRNVQNVFTRNTWDATPSGVLYPAENSYTGPRGPQGEIGGGKPPPVSPVTPKPAGTLEEVTSLLRRFATTPLMRYALPAAGGALSAGEAVRAAQELRKEEPDYLTAGLTGAGALGGLLSMFPGTAPVGIPLAVGAGLGQFAGERVRENEAAGYRPDVIPSNPMGDFGF